MHKCKDAGSRCNERISCSLTSSGDKPATPTSSVLEEGGIYHPPSYNSHVRHYQDIVNDFMHYFNRQIVAGKYRAPCIVNMDKLVCRW